MTEHDRIRQELQELSEHDLALTTAVEVRLSAGRFDRLEEALDSKVSRWTFGVIITGLSGAITVVAGWLWFHATAVQAALKVVK